jgi:tartrate-resistant acid phosphatase type 5
MPDPLIHREEYLYLPHLSDNTAIVAWGAFFFTKRNEAPNVEWDLIDDDDLNKAEYRINRHSSIGATSEPYANPGTTTEVELIEKGTANVQRQYPSRQFNHAVFTDLKPDTTYTYKITVNGRQWAAGQLHDWDDTKGAMLPTDNTYNNEFHTFPSAGATSPSLTFAILGDFGRGVKKPSGENCQKEIARTLTQVAREHDLRLILSTGDNIYRTSDGPGKEDDDWFFTYFQPYRFLLNRVPVFFCIGNHDSGEVPLEPSDDRTQIYGNAYIRERFGSLVPVDDASLEHGLFYRFRFGKDIEFVCLDTSKQRIIFSGGRFFRRKKNWPFIEKAFPGNGGPGVKWLLPFFHHPPYCAGPSHDSQISVREFFSSYFVRAGVRAVFSGHEHMFQHSIDNDRINYFVTGGSGKFNNGTPRNFEEARTQAWGGNDEGHLLLVKIEGDRLEATPYGNLDVNRLRAIVINDISPSAAPGAKKTTPFVVEA